MNIACEKLAGLDRERVLAAVLPVLSAHGVDAVELIWRMDGAGRVLELTVERPSARLPGEGITIDLCAEISRDLSAALDVEDVIPYRYRLEVGSPGLERALYGARDYSRFSGQAARLKLREPHAGQHVLFGTLHGLAENGEVVLELETSEVVQFPLEAIESARLVYRETAGQKPGHGRKSQRAPKPGRAGGGRTQ
jgi:ribosome maturation factor RimP